VRAANGGVRRERQASRCVTHDNGQGAPCRQHFAAGKRQVIRCAGRTNTKPGDGGMRPARNSRRRERAAGHGLSGERQRQGERNRWVAGYAVAIRYGDFRRSPGDGAGRSSPRPGVRPKSVRGVGGQSVEIGIPCLGNGANPEKSINPNLSIGVRVLVVDRDKKIVAITGRDSKRLDKRIRAEPYRINAAAIDGLNAVPAGNGRGKMRRDAGNQGRPGDETEFYGHVTIPSTTTTVPTIN
jgi:hypothetical protein